jgi:AcrR family transcriptional regulator
MQPATAASQPPRSHPQQARSREKVDRILAASAELLQELSYDAVGTRLIADRAGVSVGSLYRFFPDKDAIARALLAGWFGKLASIMEGAAAGGLPAEPGAFIEQAFDSYAEFFRNEPGFREVFFHVERDTELELAGLVNDEEISARLQRALAGRYGLSDPGLGVSCMIAVRVGNHLLKLAFKDDPRGDPVVLAEAKKLLRRYLGV